MISLYSNRVRQSVNTFLVLSLCSCEKDNTILTHRESDLLNECHIISIPDIRDSSEILCSDVFSKIDYIPLEDCPNSIIGSIDKLLVTNTGDYIVFDNRNGKCLRFDKFGNFVNRIGERGHRKDEYILPIDIVYNSSNDNVIIWDNAQKSLLNYDINGTFINKNPANVWHGSFEIVDSCHLAICAPYTIERHPYVFNYYVTDNKGKIQKSFVEYNPVEGFQRISNNIFSKYGNEVLCHTEYSSNIYGINADSMCLKYHVEFKNSRIPDDWFYYDWKKFRSKIHSNDDITYCYRFYETTQNYVIIVCRDFLYTCFIRKNDKDNHIGYSYRNNLTGVKAIDDAGGLRNFNLGVPVCVYDNVCYYVAEPALFEEVLKILNNSSMEKTFSNYEGINYFDSLSVNNNPILVRCVLKQI